ncbi:MAG: S9 family peptidase [Bryobacteraceae bacterium]|nr:S9 family peptidase [Bryobacteraceae bacterium]MDW8376683.1 S9 family peptidase [Bryobacterales bacterium]
MVFYLALALLAPPVCAQPKSAITHEKLWMMKRLANPVLSPDGKWVVFSVTEPSYVEAETSTDLWLIPTDGSVEPRRITSTKSGESGVAWSPDSGRIAFSARREGDEVSQIYVLDLARGGEAQRITSLSTGASAPAFSPDGKYLLFTSRVYPGAADDNANKKIAAERRARKYRARVYETFPIRHWDRWLDDMQTHLFVQPVDGSAPARDLLATTQLVSQPGFGGILGNSGEELPAVWAPDGKSIVFVATTNRTGAAYEEVLTHLYAVSVEGGEPKALTQGQASFTRPMFRPDGQALYALRELKDGKHAYAVERLVMIAWPAGGEPVPITGRLDASVTGFAFTPDSKRLYVTAEDAGLERIFETFPTGGNIRPYSTAKSGVYGALQIAGPASKPVMIATWASAVNPAEVVRLENGEHKRLTAVSAAAAEAIDWQPLRHFTFTSKRGRRIHNMLALPPNFRESEKYPLLVLIHGGPHTMWRDEITLRWNYHLLAAPGYVVLLTNYSGSTGFGEKFAQAIQGDPLRGPAEELNEAADEAIRQFPFIDGSRQCAGGASYGGHLANWLQATTTRYKCLISHAGLINLESQWGTSDSIYHREQNAGGPVWEQGPVWREQNPIRLAKNFQTPVLVTAGENDFRVPLNQALEYWSVLQRLKVPSKLIVFPDANHWILKPEDSRFFYQEVHAWLAKYLKR